MHLFVAASLLSPNVGLAIWIIIVFTLLLLLLSKFAWGPITRALEEREQTIDESISRAERALDEARRIQEDNVKARREADAEAQRVMREARDAAEKLRSEEIERTREQLRAMQVQAQAEIQREKQAAKEELRAEVADLAIRAAEKILRENIDDARQRKLVQTFIDGLPASEN